MFLRSHAISAINAVTAGYGTRDKELTSRRQITHPSTETVFLQLLEVDTWFFFTNATPSHQIWALFQHLTTTGYYA